MRVDVAEALPVFDAVRLARRLGDADVDLARAYDDRYTRNRAPAFDVSMPARVAAGDTVEVDVTWTAADAEDFVVNDRATQALGAARESIVASYLATAGAFAVERSGRDGQDRTTSTTNRGTAPVSPGVVHVWVVVRDGRGAVVWRSVDVVVE